MVIGALAGYTIVVLRLRHGFWWFMLIFGGTIFPSQMLLVPLFVRLQRPRPVRHRGGLLLVYTAINVPLAAFVLRNFYSGVAFSIFEAARMDGATTWRIFWRIYLPLSVSALAAVFILEFTFIWNDLIFGLTLTQTEDRTAGDDRAGRAADRRLRGHPGARRPRGRAHGLAADGRCCSSPPSGCSPVACLSASV